MPARVAVVITTFNRAATVVESIESVLAQTFEDFELCVVDDGSSDNTCELVSPFLSDSRVRYVSQPNGGQASALNRGIAETRAPLIGFLDSDCRWLPHKLATQVRAMDQDPMIGVVYGENRLIDAAGRPIEAPSMPRYSGMVTRWLLYDNFVNFNCSLVWRDDLDKVGGFNGELKRNPDYDVWLRLSLARPFLYLPEVLAEYRVIPGQLSADKDARYEANFAVLRSFLSNDGRVLAARERRRAWSGFYTRRGRYFASQGRLRDSLWDYSRALLSGPFDTRVWRAIGGLIAHDLGGGRSRTRD